MARPKSGGVLFFPLILTLPFQPRNSPKFGPRRLIVEGYISHPIRHTQTHPVGLLWLRDQFVAETATYTNKNTRQEYPCRQRDSNP